MTWPQFGPAVGVGIGISIESVYTELNGLQNAISISSIPMPTPILVNGYGCRTGRNRSGEILKRIETGEERIYTLDELELDLGLAD